MPLLDVYRFGPDVADRQAVMQRALLCLAAYKDRDTFTATADVIQPGGHVHVWAVPQSTTPPGWAVWSQNGDLLIVIRGTTNLQQWIGHAVGSWGAKYPDAPDNVYVHAVHYEVMDQRVWPTVRPVLEAPPPGGWKRIRVTGHSYGAALAVLLAFRLAQAGFGRRVEVVTFGGPRVFAGEFASGGPEFPLVRVEGPDDIITHLPPPMVNLRAVISTATGGVLGALGTGAGIKFVGSNIAKLPFNIPHWRHYGDRLTLGYKGELSLARGERAPAGGPIIYPERPRSGHVMDEFYWPNLARPLTDRAALGPAWRALLDHGDVVMGTAGASDPFIDWWAAAGQGRQFAMPEVTFPGRAGVTPADVRASDGVEIRVQVPARNPSIGAAGLASGGSSMATFRLTAQISWGDHSRSVSIHKTGLADIPAARNAGMLWIREYAKLFGHINGPQPRQGRFDIGIPGSPCVEWLRVSDPLQPRLSQRFRTPGDTGSGYNASNEGYESDIPWTGLSLTVAASAAGRFTRDVVSILGQPDKCVAAGGYNGNVMMQNGVTFRTALNNYLTYILPPVGSGFGTFGRDFTSAPDTPILGFNATGDGTTSIEAPTANWVAGEWIRIKGSKVAYYDREWRLSLNDDGTYKLLASRVNQAPLPAAATGYRTRLSSGIKAQVFYTYAEAFGTFDVDDRIFPSKRNPARKASPLASRRRRRTPAK